MICWEMFRNTPEEAFHACTLEAGHDPATHECSHTPKFDNSEVEK